MTTVIDAAHSNLREIPVGDIDRNPENPRLLFRAGELEQLMESIRLYGVQVPISVYRDGKRFVLIDGERRWRCSVKLNRPTIPALIQEKPAPLTNLLLMFNIHSLREQWDLMTVALKLPRVVGLLEKELGHRPNEREVAEATGLPRAVLRRSRLLADLPQQYKDQILVELNKPKPQQRVTEDFFIEMERALTTVERALPDVIPDKDRVRRVLIEKYKKKTIGNIVQFRQLGKIARAERVEVSENNAKQVLTKLFTKNGYSIEQAYNESVSAAYVERDVKARIQGLVERLSAFTPADIDDDLRGELQILLEQVQRLLEGN